ncbi:hypothetical protein GGR53DRAFT_528939 [Hypoxylon sp. FL1150]|nr:hypothetical protein GGR53DRAFT_528939 [Hypoxylon sp. FL1150]
MPEQAQGPDSLLETLRRKIELAITLIVLKQLILRVGLHEHSRKPAFVELERIDFRSHKRRTLRIASTKRSTPDDEPAWRMLALHVETTDSVDIMVKWGHAQIDGISVKVFHKDLLKKLNNGDEVGPSLFKDRVLVIPPDRRRDLLPPLNKLCKSPITTAKPPELLGKSNLQENWAPIRLTPYITQYRHFSIHHNTLRPSSCFIATRLSPEKARGFIGTTVVNIRLIMSSNFTRSHNIDPKNTIANFITMVGPEYDTELVTKIKASTKAGIEKRKNDQMGPMKFIPDFRTLLQDCAKKPKVYFLAVTNLGTIDGDSSNTDATEEKGAESHRWTIDGAMFPASPEVHHAAFIMCHIAVKGKESYVSCD